MNRIGLPRGIIENFLEDREERESLDRILNKLDASKKFSIQTDRERLEDLFLALNPQKFQERDFRKTMLAEADNDHLLSLCKKREIADKLPDNDAEKSKLINRAANFRWGNNDETRAFVEALGLEPSLIPTSKDEEPLMEQIQGLEEPYELLLDYQSDIYYQATEKLEIPNARFIIQLPTGAGKTRVAMELASRTLNGTQNGIVVWLADRTELCRQAVDAFKKIWPHVGKTKIALYRIWESRKLPANIDGPGLVVTTVSKIINYMKESSNAVKADLVIFDEAHHAAAPEYSKLILYLSKYQTRAIGLTATPGRSIVQENENKKLATLFHNTTIGIRSMRMGAIEYLQEKGVLATARKRPPIEFNDPDFELTIADWRKLAKQSDYDIDVLKKIGRSYLRNLMIAREIKKLGTENKQVLYFGTSVSQSRLMFAIARYFGFRAAHIDANTPMAYRKDAVDKFRKGEINFMFNFDIFSTGFDAKNIDVVFVARPTKSPIVLLQMIGRGMRGPKMGGTKFFDLIYVKDRFLDKFGSLDSLFELFDDYFGERD